MLAHQEAPRSPTESSTWSDADFEAMGWHDVTIHGLCVQPGSADNSLPRLLLDIDYIVRWVHPVAPETRFSFWIAPSTVVFEDVWEVEGDLDFKGTAMSLKIDNLRRSTPEDSRGGPQWHLEGHSLALTRGELATLLRLVEACFAPGWRTKGEDWSTAPGLLGTGSGPTAASDRLALLLLVLECGSRGRVRLCGGRADERHGRSATTLARLMSCTPSRAARILARLEEQGLVDRRRVKTASGLHHRARLLVPAVAAAHGASVPADVEDQAQEQAVEAAEAGIADPAPAAGVGEPPADDVSVQAPVLDVAGGVWKLQTPHQRHTFTLITLLWLMWLVMLALWMVFPAKPSSGRAVYGRSAQTCARTPPSRPETAPG
ncbi:MarR family transcriptional regulator [Streptacidiphilus sp. PB12-B1b]|uniref:MarR family transcriptional regulator n=1 Tax=Streptacidiphilus sp. PB12-B1b TaxID=2705012 RepID=UPI001CDD2551|nr:MarR family transcriptional regulator [Streptacidiphilus sp. PB12-B1b]